MEFAKYPLVLYVKPSNEVYVLVIAVKKLIYFYQC